VERSRAKAPRWGRHRLGSDLLGSVIVAEVVAVFGIPAGDDGIGIVTFNKAKRWTFWWNERRAPRKLSGNPVPGERRIALPKKREFGLIRCRESRKMRPWFSFHSDRRVLRAVKE